MERRGLAQVELAKRADVRPQELWRYLAGKRVPSLRIALQLARALRVKVERIWTLED